MGEKPTEQDESAAKWTGPEVDSDKDEASKQASVVGSADFAIDEPGTTEKAAPERPPQQAQRVPDRINLQGT